MLESNYLTILLKQNYEAPVDTPEDILQRNLKNIYTPGTESIVEIMKTSPSISLRKLANLTIVPKVINS